MRSWLLRPNVNEVIGKGNVDNNKCNCRQTVFHDYWVKG